MCTIGNVFYKDYPGWNGVFKQCDLTDKTDFLPPKVLTIPARKIAYVPFTRQKNDGTTPAWAGVNNRGVCYVAADSYLKKPQVSGAEGWNRREAVLESGETVFDMYESLITQYENAKDAADHAVDWYRRNLHNNTHDASDILLVADAKNSFFIEAKEEAGLKVTTVVKIQRQNGSFCSTNHIRMIYGAQPYEENHSTYLRLQRAEAILQANPTHAGAGELLRDKYYGDSVWSICRSKEITVGQEAPYYTQASILINVSANDAVVEYVLNGNPSQKGAAIKWHPFNSKDKGKTIDYIGEGGLV
jgi:hypothetical protein